MSCYDPRYHRFDHLRETLIQVSNKNTRERDPASSFSAPNIAIGASPSYLAVIREIQTGRRPLELAVSLVK